MACVHLSFCTWKCNLPLQAPLEQTTTSYSSIALHCTDATSVLPLPVGLPIQYQLHPLSNVACAEPYQIRRLFFPLACLYLPFLWQWILIVTMARAQHSSSLFLNNHTIQVSTGNHQFKGNQSKASSGYSHSLVPAAPFIHNSMVTYGISRIWHQPSSPREHLTFLRNYSALVWQQPFHWRLL